LNQNKKLPPICRNMSGRHDPAIISFAELPAFFVGQAVLRPRFPVEQNPIGTYALLGGFILLI